MKTALIIVLALVGLVGLLFFSFRNPQGVATSAAQQWPGEMGSLETVDARWPHIAATDSSFKLAGLADALPKSDQSLDDFVAREIRRDEITIDENPTLPDLTAIRELLLSESVFWDREDGIGDPKAISIRAKQMTIARALVANALAKARGAAVSDGPGGFVVDKMKRR